MYNFLAEKKCGKCGKIFLPAPLNVFRKDGKQYCCWTCYNHRNDGKVKPPRKNAHIVGRTYTERGYNKICVKVRCVETGIVYKSLEDASKAVWCTRALISNVSRGYGNTAKGYHWEIVEGD